jgi:acyl-CoA synthetase (AMP-forming)/AMP-acid ligase II
VMERRLARSSSQETCANGYYKDPEATKKLYNGGVLHTGDLAVWHPDGATKIQDRAKDIIISGKSTWHHRYRCHKTTHLESVAGSTNHITGGKNISSIALESVLTTHQTYSKLGLLLLWMRLWARDQKRT